MNYIVTNHKSANKWDGNLHEEGVINLNIDENGIEEIFVWGSDGTCFGFPAEFYPTLVGMIKASGPEPKPEPKPIPGLVSEDFVLALVKGIRIDSKNIR